MSTKPIFVATHPRACSTAFERVFMTRRDTLNCAHEPFGDSFYYGPERLSDRYADDEAARESSGFSNTTYQDVLDRLEKDASEGKRVFIKDMAYYLFPPDGKPASIAPSLARPKANGHTNGYANGHTNGHVDSHVNGTKTINGTQSNGIAEPGNPTVMPLDLLKKYHFTFLIRHPRRGIPSFYRCCVPPLDEATGFKTFMPNEAGYVELRRLFDYLREQQIVGPKMAAEVNGTKPDGITITVLDADDLLDQPSDVIEAFCKQTGIDYDPKMLDWQDAEQQKHASDTFAKWNGFHEDAISSTSLRPRQSHHKTPSEESEDEEWRRKYGEEAQKVIRACVNENIPHYEYLKSFAMTF